ncbi:MAG: hypothetical protein Q4E51_10215 [Lachnospiraceae bacterium]|nr:hypothetical protein [Lachnospiraceae bacterium]
MLALILTFAFIYFIMWLLVKIIGLAFKIALFPVKLIFSLLFAIIGYVVFPALIIFFVLPLIVVIIGALIGKAICI